MTLTDEQKHLVHDLMVYYTNNVIKTYDSEYDFWDQHTDLMELESGLLSE